MSKDLLLWLIILLFITIIFNWYYWRELSSSVEFNDMITSFNNNILPEKEIIEDWYAILCINDIPTETYIKNRKNTIQYYVNDTLSFSCNSEFYKWSNALDNLIELENKVENICFISNTVWINNSYFCTKKD